MDIRELLTSINLPIKYYSDFDMLEKLEEEALRYINVLGEYDCDDFKGEQKEKLKEKISEVKKEVEIINCNLVETLKCYENADPKKAQENFELIMDRLKDDLFVSTMDGWVSIDKYQTVFHINKADTFFRVRGVDRKDENIANNPDELFHIPMSKKAYTNNERFSIVGFPSLYLSTMLPLAWQESHYPKKYYYSEYQYKKCNCEKRQIENELKLLSLHSPKEIDFWGLSIRYNNFDLWLNVIIRYLKQYPLIMACSFVNHSGTVSYKQEYVIPQMLMQWVQRNSEMVQGISYFSCVDTKMNSSNWCAYNVAIPIIKPLDEKQYSEKLRKEFCWSNPKYFEIPLLNKEVTKEHREKLYHYIDKLLYALRNYYAYWCDSLLWNIKSVCVSLYQLMDKGETADMSLIIHTIEMIDRFYASICNSNINGMIEEWRGKVPEYEKEKFEQDIDPVKQIIDEFIVKSNSFDSIYSIIDRYRNTLWNDHHCQTRIIVLYSEKDDVSNIAKWLHENHFIHYVIKLKKEDVNTAALKNVCNQYNINIDDFWDEPIIDDEWMLRNYDKINTPVFIRSNSQSIYDSEPHKEMYDYHHFGFDVDILMRELT